ncbi:response regulator [candidate division FCPU426 bacterium]|nr:response regulator [candidate division FCPU426 bacterium]
MKKTIVVVDDEEDILLLIKKIFISQPFNTLLARNEKELAKILKRVKPDLILLDVMLPGKDGYEICRQLKADPASRDIPVIILTVLADARHTVKCREIGAAAHMTKPFEPDVLEAEVRRLLK